MTNTLDLPQHEYVCLDCGNVGGAVMDGCCADRVVVRPTLSYADFQAHMTAVSLCLHPVPSDEEVWDWLESHIGTEATNREAIDAAIRAVGRREDH